METRSLGSLAVSVLGLGCNNFGLRLDQAGTDEVVAAALDTGINFFDTADVYGKTQSEELLGRAARSASLFPAGKRPSEWKVRQGPTTAGWLALGQPDLSIW
jgi:predicted aldo/keto reductase-like oxidoreductase